MPTERVNKVEFQVDVDGKPVKLVAVRPTFLDESDADLTYNREYTRLFRDGALLQDEVLKTLEDRGLWDDTKSDRLKAIDAEIKANTKVFRGQVKGTTKAEARKAAIAVRKLWNERAALRSRWSELDNMTAESRAKERKFQFLVARCIRTEAGKPYFKDVDDYLKRDSKDPVVVKATEAMLEIYYDVSPSWWKKRADNAWLIANSYADENGRLIDPVNKWFVDEDGNRIDEQGRRLNGAGQLVDENGEEVDEDGLPKGEVYPFVD